MSPIESKFLRWIRRVKRGGPGRLVLGHVDVSGRGGQLGEWPVRGEDGHEALEQLTLDVMQVAHDDTDGQGAHTPQQYVALYFTEGSQSEAYSRFKFRLAPPQADFAGQSAISSEPPTEAGLVSQAMRFLEMGQRASWGGMGTVIQAMQQQLQRADERDARHEERHERRDQRYFATMDKLEAMSTEQHLRDLATMNSHQEAEDRRAFFNNVTLLGSSVMTKLGGPALLPANGSAPAEPGAAPDAQAQAQAAPQMDPVLLQHIRILMSTLEDEQIAQIQQVLTMEQAIALATLYNAVMPKKEPPPAQEGAPEGQQG